MYRRTSTLALSAVLVIYLGCSSGNGLDLARVHGTVKINGKPVQYGFVTFQPVDGVAGPPAMGTINKDGSYALTSESADDGAVVGSHHVGLIGLDPIPIRADDAVDFEKAPEEIMAKKAASGKRPQKKRGPPTFTSRSGQVYKVIVAEALMYPTTSDLKVKVERGSNTVDFDIQENGSVKVDH